MKSLGDSLTIVAKVSIAIVASDLFCLSQTHISLQEKQTWDTDPTTKKNLKIYLHSLKVQ
jgi:hypothetical protein